LTRGHQMLLALVVLAVNGIVYSAVYRRWRKKRGAK